MIKTVAVLACALVAAQALDAPEDEKMTGVAQLCSTNPDMALCRLGTAVNDALAEVDELLNTDESSVDKRKSAFVRFGKRKSSYVRFGKRKSAFVRFG